ncbi:hypothetical protein ACU4GD_26905 [Cupriavidus basilensis]
MAMAQNREGAALVGIDATRVTLLVFAISGKYCRDCRHAVRANQPGLSEHGPNAQENLVITKAFVIIILGGMGKVLPSSAG